MSATRGNHRPGLYEGEEENGKISLSRVEARGICLSRPDRAVPTREIYPPLTLGLKNTRLFLVAFGPER